MNSDNAQAVIDKIFSYDALNQLDKNALLEKYDYSSALDEINADVCPGTGQSPQTGNTISEIPPQGIVINSAGTYSFAGDIAWAAAADACSAITITASNVVLDMAGFSLTATVPDNSKRVVGICIYNSDSALSGVTVKNGTLADMCYYGIYAKNVESPTIENIIVDGVGFNNLDIRNLTPAGYILTRHWV